MRVDIAVLGPMTIRVGGSEIAAPAPKPRALLSLLAIRSPHVVSIDEISRALWGEDPPATSVKAIQGYVSLLRKILSPELVETVTPGYRLVLDSLDVDVHCFEENVATALAPRFGDFPRKVDRLGAALSFWRGPALVDLSEHDLGRNEATRLWELRLCVEEEHFAALLECGAHQTLIPGLMASVDAEPFRERRWAQLMIALFRSGRQAEALRTYQKLRTYLDVELGIEPSEELSSLEHKILQNEPELAWTPPAAVWRGDFHEVDATPRDGPHSQVPLPAELSVKPDVDLVGRQSEIDAIAVALKHVDANEGRKVLFVAGEAGTGKTALMAKASQMAFDEGACVLFGHSEEDLTRPYQFFAEALEHYVAHAPVGQLAAHVAACGPELVRLAPTLRDRLRDLPDSSATDSDSERFLLFAAVAGLLSAESEHRPIVIVLDDLQWADVASLQLLRHIVASNLPMKLLVLGAYRDNEIPLADPLLETLGSLRRRDALTRIELSGLDMTGVEAFMESLAGHAMDPAGVRLARAIHRETDGNPFFVGEVLRNLLETRLVHRDDTGHWVVADGINDDLGLPDSLREVISARVIRLGRDVELLLSLASVIGRDFDFELLAMAGGASEEDVLDALDAGASAALIREQTDPGKYSFSHALIQRTLHENLGPTRRARAHRRIAEALEELDKADTGARVRELARHWGSTNRPQDRTRALEYASQAAEAALAALAPAEALDYFSRALELTTQVPEPDPLSTLDLWIGLGTAQRQTGDPSFRATLLHAARRADELGDDQRLVKAALANDRGTFTQFGSVDLEKIELLELSLSRLSTDDPFRTLVLATLCQELTFGSPLERRIELAEEAMLSAVRLGDEAILVRVINHISDPLRVPELIEQSLARSAQGLLLAERLGDPVLHFWSAFARRVAAAGAGDLAEVDRCLEISRSLAEQLDQPTLTWVQAYGTADRVLVSGDLDEAERLATVALELGSNSGEPDASAVFGAQFVSVSSQRGTMWQLIPLIEQVAAENPGIPAFIAALAGAHVEGDRTEDARVLLEQFSATGFQLPMDVGWITGMVTYGEAAIECGEPRFAGPIYEALLPWASQFSYNDVTTEGPISHYLGGLATVLGHFDTADEHFSQSASFCTCIGANCFRARTELNWAKMLLLRGAAGDLERARELLTSAREIAVTHGYGTTERRATECLRRLAAG